MRFHRSLVLLACTLTASLACAQISTRSPASTRDAGGPRYTTDSGLGRGVNFGNMLEAPNEGDWGLTVQEVFFDKAVEAGMDHIRLPVSWTGHTGLEPPYTIDPVFMARVDWCVDRALERGLKIIVNVHHYAALNADPLAETPRALAMWSQIASNFQGRPDGVYFEVLNEPHGAFNDDPAMWDTYLAQALAVIRQTNQTRLVMAGPVFFNSIDSLASFNPPADERLIATVHYYSPFEFTHQGASWVDPSPPVGTAWTGNAFGIGGGWQNWSWGTLITPVKDGLSIEYQQGWAGLSFHRGTPLAGVRRIEFTVDRAMSLGVVVSGGGSEQTFEVETSVRPGTYSVNVPEGTPAVDRVTIQNLTPDAAPAYTLSGVSIVTGAGVETPVTTESQAIDASMRFAKRWARQQGLPMYLGEFGAYSAAEMDSRVRWTRAVRKAAEREGFAWGYWELAAGFGIYDPQAEAFREPLAEALID